MKDIYTICSDSSCTQKMKASRKDVEEYFNRLSWI